MRNQNTIQNTPMNEMARIQSKIYAIRGVQVILDRDLATLYQVETRTLKQAVKRNMERFPQDFMFELNDDEMDSLVSQSVIPAKKYFGGAKPFAFTEQGVSMLSAVLKTPIAVEISIIIIKTFVQIRHFLAANGELIQRMSKLEKRQIGFELQTSDKFEKIFDALEDKSLTPKQGIFYDGQIFDAYVFISSLIKKATKTIILIDNYIDESVLVHLAKADTNVKILILVRAISKELKLDIAKYNAQYHKITVKEFTLSHDRFLILDEKEIYHIGASLKDLGKKWFAFSKFEIDIFGLMVKVKKVVDDGKYWQT